MRQVMIRFVTIAVSICFATSSWPQQTLSENLSEGGNPTTTLTFKNLQRFASPLHPHAASNLLELGTEGKGTFRFNLEYQYDANAQFIANNSHFFQSIPTFHVGQSRQQTSWFFGKKILTWNPTESGWGLARLNNLDGISPVNPNKEGLIGLHLKHRLKNWVGELFASYIYLPIMNPGHYTEKRELLSKNEWGSIPPPSMRLKDGEAPIRYTIHSPDTKEVVDIMLNGSLGLSLLHNYTIGSVRGEIRAYGIHKPDNRLRIVAQNYFQLDSQVGHVNSTLKPFVSYHNLFGAGASHQIGPFTWHVHINSNRPRLKIPKPASNSNFFELHGYDYDSTMLANSLLFEHRSWRAGIHHLNIHQPDLYRLPINILSKIPPWHKALGVSLEYRNQRSWSGLIDIRHDTRMKNTVAKSELSYRFDMGLSAGIIAELIQCPEPKKINYWSKLRTNDTLQTYLSYQF